MRESAPQSARRGFSRSEKLVLAAGTALLILAGLFPPWVARLDVPDPNGWPPTYRSDGCRFVLAPNGPEFIPEYAPFQGLPVVVTRRVDYPRLILMCSIICAITTGVVVLLRWRRCAASPQALPASPPAAADPAQPESESGSPANPAAVIGDPREIPLPVSASDDEWFYIRSGERCGPVSRDELCRLLTAGTLTLATRVWCRTFPNWSPAGRISALQSIAAGRSADSVNIQAHEIHLREFIVIFIAAHLVVTLAVAVIAPMIGRAAFHIRIVPPSNARLLGVDFLIAAVASIYVRCCGSPRLFRWIRKQWTVNWAKMAVIFLLIVGAGLAFAWLSNRGFN